MRLNKKGDVSIRWNGSKDENDLKHATTFLISACPYEGGPWTVIDRMSLDYSPELTLPPHQIKLEIPNPLDPSDLLISMQV
jgi:hypothetical protein